MLTAAVEAGAGLTGGCTAGLTGTTGLAAEFVERDLMSQLVVREDKDKKHT